MLYASISYDISILGYQYLRISFFLGYQYHRIIYVGLIISCYLIYVTVHKLRIHFTFETCLIPVRSVEDRFQRLVTVDRVTKNRCIAPVQMKEC
jgi:hypothetical protein